MKVILEFSLPDDQEAFDDARRGFARGRALEEFRSAWRGMRKYGEIDDEKLWTLFHELTAEAECE